MTVLDQRSDSDDLRDAIRFVESASSVDPEFPGRTLVLDPGWVPSPDASPRVVPALKIFSRIIERHDLYQESLDLVNAWALRTGIVDCLLVEGVSYWFRLRETMWHWVHERLLWAYTLADLDATVEAIVHSLPSTEPALVDVATAAFRDVRIAEASAGAPSRPMRSRLVAVLPAVVKLLYRRIRPHPGAAQLERARRTEEVRDALLRERVEQLSKLDARPVLALSQPQSNQRVGMPTDASTVDPNMASVLSALEADGLSLIVVLRDVQRGNEQIWPTVEASHNVIPGYFIQAHWERPEDQDRVDAVLTRIEEGLGMLMTPLVVAGIDVTPRFVRALGSEARRVIDADVRELAAIERMIEEWQPGAILLTHEGHRTPWLVAARRKRIPTVAVQHGVLYARHPGYPDARDPRHVLPTLTCVYGDFERRALLAIGYHDAEILVSGSPRRDLDLVEVDPASEAQVRAAIRTHLGVAPDDRILVVATGWYPFMRRSHLAHMLATLLGGPLAGVHIVFKQHPAEPDGGPYRALLRGLARAAEYETPPISVVKEVDLYALLRASDAHLGHHSTVVTEAVLTGTCNLLATIQASPPVVDYVGAGVAFPVKTVADVREAVRTLPHADPAARQAFLDDHFRPGPAGRRIADAIGAAMRERPATL